MLLLLSIWSKHWRETHVKAFGVLGFVFVLFCTCTHTSCNFAEVPFSIFCLSACVSVSILNSELCFFGLGLDLLFNQAASFILTASAYASGVTVDRLDSFRPASVRALSIVLSHAV